MHRDNLKRRQQAQLPSDYKKHQLDDSSSSSDSIPNGERSEKRLRRSVRQDHKYHCLWQCKIFVGVLFFVLFCFSSFFWGGGGGRGRRMLVYV